MPQGETPENGYPLVVAAGDNPDRLDSIEEPSIIVDLSIETDAAVAAEAIFAARAAHDVADTAMYAVSTAPSGDAILESLHSTYPGLFAGMAFDSADATTSPDVVSMPTVVSFTDGDQSEVIKELFSKPRAHIYDAAVLHPGITADQSPELAHLATDNDLETAYSAESEATLTLTLDQTLVVHRWALEFGEQPPTSVTFETSIDGSQWEQLEDIDVETEVIDRYTAPREAIAVRVQFDGGEISDFRVHGQLADERLFTHELYTGDGIELPYRLFVPEGQPSDSPVTLFLHGSGQRGSDNSQHLGVTKGEGAIRWVSEDEQAMHESIVIAPQIDTDSLWRDTEVIEALDGLIAEVAETFDADLNRVYGTGLSIGAEGLLNIAIEKPNLFAAMLLVAGGPNNPVGGGPEVEETVIPNAEVFAHIPIWELQAFDDSVRPIEKTTGMIDALRELGVEPRYTVYLPGVIEEVATSSHSSWILAYEDPRVGEWMFSQQRDKPAIPGEPLEPIGVDLTAEDLIELAEPGAVYYEFH